jgi:O-acetyl-ADP-ribose deacetylase (regulator of RNase III)
MFYNSSVELVSNLLKTALSEASQLGAKTVATPAIATGYGPLSMDQFSEAIRVALAQAYPGLEEVRIVLRDRDDADRVAKVVGP